MPSAIHPISGANVNPQFRYALAHRFRVAQVAGFNLAEPGGNADLGRFVAKTAEPFGVWFTPILVLVTDKFDHGRSVA